MDLDESTNLGELDMDDEAQANSMLRMMDYGRRSGVECTFCLQPLFLVIQR